jgi:hypothetical protein
MKRSYLFLPLLLLMTFILSCDKDNFSPTDEQDDFNLENFLSDSYFSTYNSHYNPLPLLESRSSELMTKAVKDYFAKNPKEAKKVEAKYGMLIWDRSFYMDGELGHFIKIPLAKKNSKNVEAVLFATLNANNKAFNFVIHDRKDIRKKAKKKSAKKNAKGYYLEITQEYLSQKLIYFDHVSFQVKDCSLAEFLPSETGLNSESLEERSCYYVQSYAGNDYTIVNGELIIYPVYDYYYICFGGSGDGGGYTEDSDNDGGNGGSSGQGGETEEGQRNCTTVCHWSGVLADKIFATQSFWGVTTQRGSVRITGRIDVSSIFPTLQYNQHTTPVINVSGGNCNVDKEFYEISSTPASATLFSV